MFPSIRTLEELSLNAWPALQTAHYDGWLLRFAAGYTRRANSVSVLYPSRQRLAEKVAYCEAAYTARNLPTVFKVTAAAEPEELDAFLEARGYHIEAPTSLYTCDLTTLSLPHIDGFTLYPEPTERWLEAFCTLSDIPARHRPTMGEMLRRFGPPTTPCFMAREEAGEITAVGLAVAEGGWVGLFDIVVAPGRRGQGVGTRLVQRLIRWGQEQGGARHAYLQVMQENETALRLYRRLGFTEAYSYWYRVRPLL
jgi:ribosomal protein S18 acetylase RimI-like enzyme